MHLFGGAAPSPTFRLDAPGPGFAPNTVGPPDTVIGGFAANSTPNEFLGTPDVWLVINVGGTLYQFPGYA